MSSKSETDNMKTLQVVNHITDSERKKRNRKSKLFYVSCDYLDVNDENTDSKQSGYVLNVHSDPLNIQVDNSTNSEKERKKRNRKSKLFYVSCEHFDFENEVCIMWYE